MLLALALQCALTAHCTALVETCCVVCIMLHASLPAQCTRARSSGIEASLDLLTTLSASTLSLVIPGHRVVQDAAPSPQSETSPKKITP
jgi:hypothetical protein